MDDSEHTQPEQVILTLLCVSNHVQNDPNADDIRRLVTEEVHPLANACYVEEFVQGSQRKSSEKVQHQVLRFLQTKDKYTALGSMLLKSQIFHRIHGSSVSSDEHSTALPVVELPRTCKKKPYIPAKQNEKASHKVEECDLYPFSISHQMPFVGSARYDTMEPTSYKIGLDIVSFDPYNPRLYSHEQEFVDVFKESFTAWEWNQVNTDDGSRIHELYVRWAMKEAYTKALGVGMGLQFGSFDMRPIDLKNVDGDDHGKTQPVWPQVAASREKGIWTRVNVVHPNTEEQWLFFFLALKETQDEVSNDNKYRGSACVCIGPLDSSKLPTFDGEFPIEIEWTSLEKSIEWHENEVQH